MFDVDAVIQECDNPAYDFLMQRFTSMVKYSKWPHDVAFDITMAILDYLIPRLMSELKPTMFTINGVIERTEPVGPHEPEFTDYWLQALSKAEGPIMQVKSNWGLTVNPDYTPKQKKPKKKKKGTRRTPGNGSSFGSQTTYTVSTNKKYGSQIYDENGEMLPSKLNYVKVFCKRKFVIPYCIRIDNRYAKKALSIVLNQLNNHHGVGYYVNWRNVNRSMNNFRCHIQTDQQRCKDMCKLSRCFGVCRDFELDLGLFTRILQKTWKKENMACPPNREVTSNYQDMLVYFRSGYLDYVGEPTTVTVCIPKSGRMTINGTVSTLETRFHLAVYRWCNWIICKYRKYVMIKLNMDSSSDESSSSSDSDESDSSGDEGKLDDE